MYIAENIKDLQLSVLNLTTRQFNSLDQIGANTVGAVVSLLGDSSDPRLSALSQRTVYAIRKHIDALIASSTKEGELNWKKYCKYLDLPILPADYNDISIPAKAIEVLPKLIKEILSDERLWYIVQRRFGLENTEILTLQDLGDAFGGISRQRIDQLEKAAISKLRDVLIEQRFTGKRYRAHPAILSVISQLISVLGPELRRGIVETDLLNRVQAELGLDSESTKNTIFLLLRLAGANSVIFRDSHLVPVWGYFDKHQKSVVERGIRRIDYIITVETSLPLTEFDLLRLFNKGVRKGQKITLYQLQWLIDLCSSAEKTSNGMIWGKFECLKKRINQIERILFESQEPLHIDDIVREINYRLVPLGYKKVNRRNIVNQLSKEEKFVHIGRSGYWGLRDWEFTSKHILHLMEECLITHNRPVTEDELYNYVVSRRPANTVQRSSITFYLSTKDIFAKVGKEKWGLSRWSNIHPSQDYSPEGIAELVSRIFRAHKTKRLEYKVLKHELMAILGVSERQAQGLLNTNPVIKTERVKYNEIYAVFQPNYKSVLAQRGAGYLRKKETNRQKVAHFVQEQLKAAPGQEMLLSDLITRIQQEFHFSQRTTPYRYLYMLDFVERIKIPGTREKLCRLKGKPKGMTFPEVSLIKDVSLRERVKKAVSFLTLDNIDIGLFLLSRELEAVLKSYIKCKFPKEFDNQKHWNLNRMINFVKSKGVISNDMDLHFLRQKRNERAHGSMPTLQERKELMGSARYVAGLYIHYIKLFDELC